MGDEGNMCGSVACDGGMRGACPGGETEGAFRKVKCAQVHHTPSRNRVTHGAGGVGVWGGQCTCPDGNVYLAGALGRLPNPPPLACCTTCRVTHTLLAAHLCR